MYRCIYGTESQTHSSSAERKEVKFTALDCFRVAPGRREKKVCDEWQERVEMEQVSKRSPDLLAQKNLNCRGLVGHYTTR